MAISAEDYPRAHLYCGHPHEDPAGPVRPVGVGHRAVVHRLLPVEERQAEDGQQRQWADHRPAQLRRQPRLGADHQGNVLEGK